MVASGTGERVCASEGESEGCIEEDGDHADSRDISLMVCVYCFVNACLYPIYIHIWMYSLYVCVLQYLSHILAFYLYEI